VAGVIKAEEAHRPDCRHGEFSLGDFALEGRQIVAAARAQAEQLVEEARAVGAQIRQEAHQQGYERGHQKGLEEGRVAGRQEALEKTSAEFEARLVQLASACESQFREVDRRKRELLLASHRDLVALAVAVAERVTKRIGLVDRQTVTDNLLGVIDLVGQTSDMVVAVNPVDAETLEQFASDLVARRGDLKHVEVRPDDGVHPGGCVVKTCGGQIDATLETQLARIAQELVPDPGGGEAEQRDGEAKEDGPAR